MAKKLTADMANAILWGSKQLGINPNHLASVISFETGGTFNTNARNPKTSGTGLIQFMDYADGKKDKLYYGMTRNQFGRLSPKEQMAFVVKYFKGKGLKQGASIGQVYDAVTGTGYKKGSRAYALNKVWDANKDGYIAPGESVTSGHFKAHMRDFFGNGQNYQAKTQQPEAPPPDPRLTMSAPELLASLKKEGKLSDNELFVNLANGNGRAAQEINHLLAQGHNPAEIAGQLGLKVDVAGAPTNEQPTQKPKGFGTFETIASELPKLKAQGLNPYQAMYSLAQRQDKVGESIRTAYKQGMGAEQLSNYFGVDKLWTSNQPSNSASSKLDKQASPTALSM